MLGVETTIEIRPHSMIENEVLIRLHHPAGNSASLPLNEAEIYLSQPVLGAWSTAEQILLLTACDNWLRSPVGILGIS